ncbi:PLDc N-terminal domain-containing protein [Kocuria oceani]|uniref:PLDc N-terminal domain-containing protein n=1 Tax=Kocuria oceani TaxID=988827 RepID=UPI0040360848
MIPHNRHPAAAWGWLLIIIIFPILGILAFLLIGRADLPQDRKTWSHNSVAWRSRRRLMSVTASISNGSSVASVRS